MTERATMWRMAMKSKQSDEPKPFISVITVFWNGRDEAEAYALSLARCREALPFAMEVVVVDNASSDGTADWFAVNAPWIRLIRNPTNAGFPAGCNAGIKQAMGKVLLLLNPDCESNPEAISAMAGLLMRKPEVGIASCTLLNDDGSVQYNAYREPGAVAYLVTHSVISGFFDRVRRLAPRVAPGKIVKTDWLMGAFLATRRDVVERIGLMNEQYFLYAEDTDWCRRARDAGYSVVLMTRPTVRHRQGTSARKRKEFTFRQIFRSILRYSRLHHSASRRLLLSATIVADMAVRIPLYAVLGRFTRMKSAFVVIGLVFRGE